MRVQKKFLPITKRTPPITTTPTKISGTSFSNVALEPLTQLTQHVAAVQVAPVHGSFGLAPKSEELYLLQLNASMYRLSHSVGTRTTAKTDAITT